MINKTWYFVPINPQPWTVPPFSPARKNGKLVSIPGRNEANEVFKQAIRDEMEKLGAFKLEGQWNRITFGFWRLLDKYEDTAGRTRTKNWSDGTNMCKLVEDALQGILYDNDRNNFEVTWRIVQQSSATIPGILILCETFDEIPDWVIPEAFADSELEIIQAIRDAECAVMDMTKELKDASENAWPPRP